MNWISGNAYLAQYIPRKVNGDVKAPTSKASQEEWAGYYFCADYGRRKRHPAG